MRADALDVGQYEHLLQLRTDIVRGQRGLGAAFDAVAVTDIEYQRRETSVLLDAIGDTDLLTARDVPGTGAWITARRVAATVAGPLRKAFLPTAETARFRGAATRSARPPDLSDTSASTRFDVSINRGWGGFPEELGGARVEDLSLLDYDGRTPGAEVDLGRGGGMAPYAARRLCRVQPVRNVSPCAPVRLRVRLSY